MFFVVVEAFEERDGETGKGSCLHCYYYIDFVTISFCVLFVFVIQESQGKGRERVQTKAK